LLSDEQFFVDGTLIEAWASQKSFKPKSQSSGEDPRNGSGGDGRNWHEQKRSNETQASPTAPESRLYRRAAGREAGTEALPASPQGSF
jgi:hypothetical protein